MSTKKLQILNGFNPGSQETIIAKDVNADGNIVLTNYVSDSYAEHIGDFGNPHNVTIEQVGAAPAGYGLGETSIYCADCNNAYKNGWYKVDANTANLPAEGVSGTLFVHSFVTDNGTDTYQTITSGVTVIQRYYSSWAGEWQPWGWVNPPMQVDVEYRTTERIEGEVVYKKKDSSGKILYRLDGETAWKAQAALMGAAPSGYGYGDQPHYIWFSDYANESTLNTRLQEVFASMSDLTTKQIQVTYKDGGTILGTLYRYNTDYGFFHAAGYNGKILLKTKVNGTWNGYVDFSSSQPKTHTVTANSSFVNGGSITAHSSGGVLSVGGYIQTKAAHPESGTSVICTIPGIEVLGLNYTSITDRSNGKNYDALLLTEGGTTRLQLEGASYSLASGAWINFSAYGIIA